MVTTKILIPISILHLIIYNKKQYRYIITISSVFILLCRLSANFVGLIKKTENVFNCRGENLVRKKNQNISKIFRKLETDQISIKNLSDSN